MQRARAVLLSKTSSPIAQANQTRMLTVQPLLNRIYDRALYELSKPILMPQIGAYQKGFKPGSSTLDNIVDLCKRLHIGRAGRKPLRYALFIDFTRAFDLVDRRLLLEILDRRLADCHLTSLFVKLLQPQEVNLPTGGTFLQQKGVPQGLSCSPMMFNTYLDDRLKQAGLD